MRMRTELDVIRIGRSSVDPYAQQVGGRLEDLARCRGVLLWGLDAPPAGIEASFAPAAPPPACKGFAVGRTIFGALARAWMQGAIKDDEAVRRIAGAYARLIQTWERARSRSGLAAASSQPTARAVTRE